uniref:hypothetical protein n=1 Tax=Sphingomonas bacterium TaxID=1895847 RepID=UPI00260B25CE|nr:hypothetical protein [Sphingomonas bacterium]
MLADSGRRGKVPVRRKNILVALVETFPARAHFQFKFLEHEMKQAMKSVVPIFLALIPLFAVVGACVAVP